MLTHTYKETKHPDLFRIVSEDGNWTHYLHKPSGKILRSVNFILDGGFAKTKQFYEWLKRVTPEEAERKLSEGGEKGDAVHRMIEQIFANGGKADRSSTIYSDEEKKDRTLTNKEWDCILAFAGFWQAHQPKLVAYELPLFNIKRGYAGTTDAILSLTRSCGSRTCRCAEFIKKPGLWDWKSSGGIYDSYGPQVSAYAGAENIKEYSKKVAYTAVLRLGTKHKSGYEIEFYDAQETKKHQKEFLAAITIQDSAYKPFDPQKDIREIPDEINLTI